MMQRRLFITLAGVTITASPRLALAQGLDRVDLSSIDARPDQAGDQAFTWLGSVFTGLRGELRFRQVFGAAEVSADPDGDARRDLKAEIDSMVELADTEFLL
jgi:hypothetical protein